MFLSDAELALMRADVAAMLPSIAVLQVFGKTRDATGAYTETWTPVTGGTVACRIDPINPRGSMGQLTVAAQEAVEAQFQLTVPYDAPITVDQRVVIDSVAYEIKVLHATHSWNVDKRATVTRID